MDPSLSTFRCLSRGLAVAAALGGLGAAYGQTSLVGNSPFAPASASGLASGAPAEAYELSGSMVEGSEVSVCIFERQAKHSRWIPVGETTDGVRVVSFDALRDTAVVMIAGSRKELSMRKAVVAALDPSSAARPAPVAGPPAPQAAPIASAPPAAPANAAQEQREARMLVSDLLEIGVQQRKAYQEAKQRAATATPPPPDN